MVTDFGFYYSRFNLQVANEKEVFNDIDFVKNDHYVIKIMGNHDYFYYHVLIVELGNLINF